MNKKLGWVCRDDRAPVDLVTEQSMLMSVLHVPTPVLVLETQRLDPKVAVVDPKRPPQAVCVLRGSAAGLSGYVSWAALHDAPCQR